MFEPKSLISVKEVTIGAEATGIVPVPSEEFFQWRAAKCNEHGVMPDPGNMVPLPKECDKWHTGTIGGTDALVYLDDKHLYVLTETPKTGYCLFHWESTKDKEFYKSAQDYVKPIIERRVFVMTQLQQLARNSNLGGGANFMNLQNNETPTESAVTGMTGGNVDMRLVQRMAMAHGYVFGYVMGAAPRTTMRVQRTKTEGGGTTATIVATQSKPTRPLSVLLSLPKRCCMHNNILCTPQDIRSGNIDWDAYKDTDLAHVAMDVNAAIAYIYALGGRLPEYAPNVSDQNRQWSDRDILSESPNVSWVYVKAAASRSATSRNAFRQFLKTTSGRRILYTPKNYVALTALKHTKIPGGALDDAKAYELNESAFGHWRYRFGKDSKTDQLTRAMADCPTQIWEKTYTIDGTKQTGIGSTFFMGDAEVNGSGEPMPRTPLEVFPWYLSGDLKPKVPSICESIVERHLGKTKDGKKPRMETTTLRYSESKTHQMFTGYKSFVEEAIRQGYFTEQVLMDMSTTTRASNRKPYQLDDQARAALDRFMMSDNVRSSVESVLGRMADAVVMGSRK